MSTLANLWDRGQEFCALVYNTKNRLASTGGSHGVVSVYSTYCTKNEDSQGFSLSASWKITRAQMRFVRDFCSTSKKETVRSQKTSLFHHHRSATGIRTCHTNEPRHNINWVDNTSPIIPPPASFIYVLFNKKSLAVSHPKVNQNKSSLTSTSKNPSSSDCGYKHICFAYSLADNTQKLTLWWTCESCEPVTLTTATTWTCWTAAER